MPEGDEFIKRFTNVQLARLDIGFIEFTNLCKMSIETYDVLHKIEGENKNTNKE